MRKELWEEIEDYVYFMKTSGTECELLGYKEIEKKENVYYANLYEGGNYMYDEEQDKLYYIEINYE